MLLGKGFLEDPKFKALFKENKILSDDMQISKNSKFLGR